MHFARALSILLTQLILYCLLIALKLYLQQESKVPFDPVFLLLAIKELFCKDQKRKQSFNDLVFTGKDALLPF